jgi:hypothetical protein
VNPYAINVLFLHKEFGVLREPQKKYIVNGGILEGDDRYIHVNQCIRYSANVMRAAPLNVVRAYTSKGASKSIERKQPCCLMRKSTGSVIR